MTEIEQKQKAKQFAVQIRLLEEQYQIYLCGNKVGNVEDLTNGTLL